MAEGINHTELDLMFSQALQSNQVELDKDWTSCLASGYLSLLMVVLGPMCC
jgi:hypothetical protein